MGSGEGKGGRDLRRWRKESQEENTDWMLSSHKVIDRLSVSFMPG
jgi:hypothetical protein